MILVDTGAFYALIDRNDVNHISARKFYESIAGKEVLCTSLPVLTEAWLLVEARLGTYFADLLVEAVAGGAFDILPLGAEELQLALAISREYADTGFGFVDSTCFALCEKHKIGRVFTYDRKHFSIYRPRFKAALELLP